MIKTERKKLLWHWFTYYGHDFVTLDEMELVNNLIINQEDKVRMYILACCLGPKLNGRVVTTEILIKAIRDGVLEELLKSLPSFESLPKSALDYYKTVEDALLEEFEGTYLKPEEPVYMDVSEVLKPGESAAVINLDNIDEPNRGITIVRKPK